MKTTRRCCEWGSIGSNQIRNPRVRKVPTSSMHTHSILHAVSCTVYYDFVGKLYLQVVFVSPDCFRAALTFFAKEYLSGKRCLLDMILPKFNPFNEYWYPVFSLHMNNESVLVASVFVACEISFLLLVDEQNVWLQHFIRFVIAFFLFAIPNTPFTKPGKPQDIEKFRENVWLQ